MNKCKIILFIIFSVLIAGKRVVPNNSQNHIWSNSNQQSGFGKLGQFGFPSNPMNDRAIGYLFKGKAKTAVTNYGEFIEWDVHPAGLWGDYTYLPDVCFVAGLPGQSYSYRFNWYNNDTNSACPSSGDPGYTLWCSDEAYDDPNELNPYFSWYEYGDTNYVGVLFEHYNDQGIVGIQKDSDFEFTGKHQWVLDELNQRLIISLEADGDYDVNPNIANAYGNPNIKKSIGLIYPWGLRPKLVQRLDDFDLFDYGQDGEEWTFGYCKDENDAYIYVRDDCINEDLDVLTPFDCEDNECGTEDYCWCDEMDQYEYYGANTAESWFTRWNPSSNTDWQPSTQARDNTHNNNVNAGDMFGDEVYVSPSNTYPLLAHSEIEDTWPDGYDNEGNLVPKWPGGYAESYSPEETGCFPAKRWNDECWIDTERFISNQDVYMEFDDRWAHRGSNVNNNVYEQAGYPMGLKVMATAHSYSVAFAEDIMFVTVDVRNESGDNWCAFEKNRYGDRVYVTDNDGNLICGDGMVMPDGTKLNRGKGFTYRDMSMGFYMDADVVSTDIYGNFGVHTNNDDFMEYYDCANPDIVPEGCKVINDDTLRVSVAMIYDYDNQSGAASNIGIVATQLLDSPYATQNVDLNGDGYFDIYRGDKLQMTDWHWFDWYNRPGVVYREGDAGCCAGDPGSAQAENKEEIQYKIIAGDTTNLSANEKFWFFHTENPCLDENDTDSSCDSDIELNPHFDSLEGLSQTKFFTDTPDGLDCVLQMSSGPFSIEVGEQVPFSFCIIFGQNKNDLIENARFAQLMYNSHYQGYTEPDAVTVDATFDQGEITLSWDQAGENSTDVVTGYSDFGGYKIYKSVDGGSTWGTSQDKIYDENGNHVGWVPYAQFHLTAEQDSLHCVYSNDYHNPDVDPSDGVGDNHALWPVFDCGDNNADGVPDIRGYSICGPDPHANHFSLGNCDDSEKIISLSEETCLSSPKYSWDANNGQCYYDINNNGQWDQEIGIVNSFTDYDVVDGIEYTYSVTSYDMGISPDYTTESLELDNGFFVQDTTYQSANPLHFATPYGYQSIEGGRGTSRGDKNFVTLTSGSQATTSLTNDIKVVPNPYIVRSNFNENEYTNKIRFTHLPAKCTITIYTISGEEVVSLEHDDATDGNLFWNLRTINNQVIAPGLYIFTVIDGSGEKFIGKFAVVR